MLLSLPTCCAAFRCCHLHAGSRYNCHSMCPLPLYRLALRARLMVRGPLVLVWGTPMGTTQALVARGLVQVLILVLALVMVVWAPVPALARQ